jgi:hypothetical protein
MLKKLMRATAVLKQFWFDFPDHSLGQGQEMTIFGCSFFSVARKTRTRSSGSRQEPVRSSSQFARSQFEIIERRYRITQQAWEQQCPLVAQASIYPR